MGQDMKRYSRFSCLLLCISLFLSAASLAQETTATVLSVFKGGDALKIRDDKGERLVALYGVRVPTLSLAHQKNAEQFTSENVLGDTIHVRTVTEIAGLSYVEITLPEGSILNHLLVRQGLAEVDSLTASKDVLYSRLEQEARDQGLGIWSERGSLSNELPQQEMLSASDAVQASRQFQQRKELVSIAKFESEYVKWRALPESYRIGYMNFLLTDREGHRVANDALVDSRSRDLDNASKRVQENKGRISQQQRNLELESANQQAAIADAYDDFDLDWHTSIAESFRAGQAADYLFGDKYSYRINAKLATKYEILASWDLERVDAEARARSDHYENRKSGIRGALSYLDKERRNLKNSRGWAEGKLRIANTLGSRHEARRNQQLVRIATLNQAIEDEYEPYLGTTVVESWSNTESVKTPSFSMDANVWRIDWHGGKGFRALLHSSDDDSIVAHIGTSRPLHQSFEIVEKLGEFYIEVKASRGAAWMLNVVEFDY